MSYLKNLRSKGTAEIGNVPVSESGKIRDSNFHPFIIIDTYISGGRISNNVVIKKHGRCVASLEVTNPWIIQRKADCKCAHIIMFQHKHIIMLIPLYLNINRYDFNIKTDWFSHLAKTDQNVIGKMIDVKTKKTYIELNETMRNKWDERKKYDEKNTLTAGTPVLRLGQF